MNIKWLVMDLEAHCSEMMRDEGISGEGVCVPFILGSKSGPLVQATIAFGRCRVFPYVSTRQKEAVTRKRILTDAPDQWLEGAPDEIVQHFAGITSRIMERYVDGTKTKQ